MINKMPFDFIVDKEKHTLFMKRGFDASQQLVWDCYTKSELLEQWFAPKPLTAKTRHMEFSPGGRWHYAMIDPQGTAYWGLTEFIEIVPISYYTSLDAFSDAGGNINPELPRAHWKVCFRDDGLSTVVETTVTYQNLADLETVINMGMQEGMTSALERLDDLLTTFTK